MNPQPAIRNPQSRAGLTLAEVLIAMGVLAVGLLGVAAVFPVGGHYMQSGDVADRGGAIAQAALADAVVRGHLDPDNWVVHDVNNQSWNATAFTASGAGPNRFIEFVSGMHRASLTGDAASRLFRRKLGLAEALAAAPAQGPFGARVADGYSYRAGVFGSAYVIDPIGLAAALEDDQDSTIVSNPSTVKSGTARHFPGFVGPIQYRSNAWLPWADPGLNSSANWPVRRVTSKRVHPPGALNDPNLYALQQPVAQRLFSTSDDLAQFFPESGDEPVRQRWETWGNGSASGLVSVRQSRGDYSWLISVAPGSPEARDALATQPDAYPVEVSAVVFYKRTAARGPQQTADAERLVRARVVSVSPGGGELLLTRRPPPGSVGPGDPVEPEVSPFEDLRPGQFVMVVGPHPQSFVGNATTPSRPMLAVRWCRVLGIEDGGRTTLADGSQVDLSGDDTVLVSFRGPDWPWRPATNNSGTLNFNDPTLLPNDLRVAILPGAVAVHTKTMRLEAGSEWAID